MRQAVEFYFRDGSKRLALIRANTQAAIIRKAETTKRRLGAAGYVLRGSEYDPRVMSGLRTWIARGIVKKSPGAWKPYAVAQNIISRATPTGLSRLVKRFSSRRPFDPRILRLGVGKVSGQPHGYLGRHVLDLGDRHAHAIVDVPWDALKVNLANLKAKFDPWRRALKGFGARLLAVRNPKPTGSGDRAIVEAAIHVGRRQYEALKQSGEFDLLPDGVLARRGRKKKATNIFVMP